MQKVNLAILASTKAILDVASSNLSEITLLHVVKGADAGVATACPRSYRILFSFSQPRVFRFVQELTLERGPGLQTFLAILSVTLSVSVDQRHESCGFQV
jgi:hypothetical protein